MFLFFSLIMATCVERCWWFVVLFVLGPFGSKCLCVNTVSLPASKTCSNVTIDEDYCPHSPRVLCCLVPEQFYICDELMPVNGTDEDEVGVCSQFGGEYFEEVQFTSVNCSVLSGVECHGEKTFIKTDVPCVRYGGHYFPTIMLYSVFLGFLGVDRFCLGYTCLGVAKLLTLGAIGVWWVVDVFLLLSGMLVPNGNYTWEQVY